MKTDEPQKAQSEDYAGEDDETFHILITIDLIEQKVLGCKFCKSHEQMMILGGQFRRDFGDHCVTFAHSYDINPYYLRPEPVEGREQPEQT